MREKIYGRGDRNERASFLMVSLTCVCVGAFLATPASSHPPDADHTHMAQQDSGTKHGSLGNVGNKLSDPTANVWAMSTSFQVPEFFDGDASGRNPQLGGGVNIQPVLPFPIYGTGENQWKLVTRPVIPIIFNQPISKGEFNRFRNRGGIGDIQLPLLINPSAGIVGKNVIFGAGPVFEFPSSTSTWLGNEQFSVGPAVVLGYKTETVTVVLFPNYFFGFADRSDRKDTTRNISKLSMLYVLNIALPNAWQVGFNPTISYNDKAALKRDKWTVPVGLYGGKTIKVGKMPLNIKLGMEYSVVSPDSYGKRAQIRLQLTPVLPGLVSSPIFGGK
jgi:hypothetical protein